MIIPKDEEIKIRIKLERDINKTEQDIYNNYGIHLSRIELKYAILKKEGIEEGWIININGDSKYTYCLSR